MASFRFERLVILESLDEDDYLKSGEELCNFLRPLLEDNKDPIVVEFRRFASANDLKEIIFSLTEEVLNGHGVPAIHIECHGNRDRTGLFFEDESSLTWEELGSIFLELNRATRFNLLLVIAACYGGEFFTSRFRLGNPCPFWGFVAPSHLTHGPELLGSFRTFYRELFLKRNPDGAFALIGALRLDEGKFMTRVADEIFYDIYEVFFRERHSPPEFNERIKRITDLAAKQLTSHYPAYRPTFQEARRVVINSDLDFYHKSFSTFFMLDTIPENLERFSSIIKTISDRFPK